MDFLDFCLTCLGSLEEFFMIIMIMHFYAFKMESLDFVLTDQVGVFLLRV